MLQLILKSRPLFTLTLIAIWVLIFSIPYLGRVYRKEVAMFKGKRTVAASVMAPEDIVQNVQEVIKSDDSANKVENIIKKVPKIEFDGHRYAGVFHQDNTCLDTLDGVAGSPIGLWDCHGEGGNQFWTINNDHSMKSKNLCVEGPLDLVSPAAASMQDCKQSKPQSWEYLKGDQMIRLLGSNICMESLEQKKVIVNTCNKSNRYQKWKLKVPQGM